MPSPLSLHGRSRYQYRFEEEEPTAEEESWFLTRKNVMLKSHDDIVITLKYADEETDFYSVLPNKIDYQRPLLLRIVVTPSLLKQFRFTQLYARVGVINGTGLASCRGKLDADDDRDDVQINGRFDILRGRTFQRVHDTQRGPSHVNIRLSLTAAGNISQCVRKKNKFSFRVELYNGLCPDGVGRASSTAQDSRQQFDVDSPPSTPPRQTATALALQQNLSPSRKICVQEHGLPIIVKESSQFFVLSQADEYADDLQDLPWHL